MKKRNKSVDIIHGFLYTCNCGPGNPIRVFEPFKNALGQSSWPLILSWKNTFNKSVDINKQILYTLYCSPENLVLNAVKKKHQKHTKNFCKSVDIVF